MVKNIRMHSVTICCIAINLITTKVYLLYISLNKIGQYSLHSLYTGSIFVKIHIGDQKYATNKELHVITFTIRPKKSNEFPLNRPRISKTNYETCNKKI